VSSSDEASSGDVREIILQAAFDELVVTGIDRFTFDRVSVRAGVDVGVIETLWHDRRVLLMEAVLSSSESIISIPDTGTLRGDLALSVESAVAIASTPEGRRQLRSMLPLDRDFDPTCVQKDFWDNRFAAWAVTFRRAAERGELRDDVDPLTATLMLAGAINAEVLFTDNPIGAAYVEQVLEIFLRGICR
jgi:Tetracyclin repressor-like, C-terminal domain